MNFTSKPLLNSALFPRILGDYFYKFRKMGLISAPSYYSFSKLFDPLRNMKNATEYIVKGLNSD